MKSPQKRVVLIVILIAAVLLAVFPGRRAVREYRFQSALADWAESSGTNAEHISVCLDMMRDLIDRAVDAETVTGQRDCLLALAYWTQDCADSLGTVQTYVRYFETCAGTTVRDESGDAVSWTRQGLLRLNEALGPYITGEAEGDDGFREALLQAKAELLWFRELWDSAFTGELSGQEFAGAFHQVFGDQAAFANFLTDPLPAP